MSNWTTTYAVIETNGNGEQFDTEEEFDTKAEAQDWADELNALAADGASNSTFRVVAY